MMTKLARTCLVSGVLGQETFDRLSEARLQQVRANVVPTRRSWLGAGFPPLTDEQVRRIEAPTLLLGGEKSPPLFHRFLDHLDAVLPRSHGCRFHMLRTSCTKTTLITFNNRY